MHKTARGDENTRDEELHIDAKLGFTVLHPLNWERIRIPVSSPLYRQESVLWKIAAEEISGSMLIRVYPVLASATELQKLLTQFIESKTEHSGGTIEPFQDPESFLHEAGEAVAIILTYQDHTERVFAIRGSHNTYILSFSLRSEMFAAQLPLFERIAQSFREL